MAEAHFTAPDHQTGTDGRGQEDKSFSIARRSTSIFSRRGAEDQDSKPSITYFMHTSRPQIAPQHSWLGKMNSIRSESRSHNDTKIARSKGTVLNAVPPARTIEMTPLEEEMATSPNEEILSAIGECPPQHQHKVTGVSLPGRARASLRSHSSGARKLNRHSQKHSDTEHRIGTWINGVAHFDHSALDYWTPRKEFVYEAEMHSRVISTGGKPHLSVHIPEAIQSEDKTPTNFCPQRSFTAPMSFSTSQPAVELPAPLEPACLNITEPQSSSHLRVSCHRSHPSQSSTSSQAKTDASSVGSVYSRRSSMTSVDTLITVDCHPLKSASKFSLLSPIQAGVFDDISPNSSVTNIVNINKELPPTPAATPPLPSSTDPTSINPPRWSKSLKVESKKTGVHKALLQCRSMSELRLSEHTRVRHGAVSPTLSEAEHELSSQLSAMGKQRSSWLFIDDQTNEQDLLTQALKRKDSVREVMQPPLERAPTLPKRSRKRDWRAGEQQDVKPPQGATLLPLGRRRSDAELGSLSNDGTALPLRKTTSLLHKDGEPKKLVMLPRLSLSTGATTQAKPAGTESQHDDHGKHISPDSPYSDVSDAAMETAVPANSAEVVLLKILCSLNGLSDLFNTAIINKGMYRVYKEHEMELIKTVTWNQSAPAFELREWKHPEVDDKMPCNTSPIMEHTPRSYVASYRQDLAVIQQLKRLIHEKCGTFIRRETTFALSTPTHPNAQRFDDALWRIWCFTFIFGSRKGREEDISNQLSWIQGDLLNEARGCAATIETSLDFDMSSVLLSAPAHFAVANRGGLTAAQLFDVTEMWTCLSVLLHGYSGRVEQARESGIFDKCDVIEGDIENEERLLEEWLAYIVTLGPNVVLEMALLASDNSAAGFTLAQKNSWTEWKPPIYNSSMSNFLKEPVAIIYSEQIVAAKIRLQDPHEQEQKILSRRRVASMAAEIRLRRQSSEYKRLPLIGMDSERPMSVMSRSSTRTTSSSSSSSAWSSSSSRSSRISPSSSQIYRSPASYWTPPQSISPIPEDYKPETSSSSPTATSGFQKTYVHHNKSYASGGSDNTSDLAVAKLVSMGFPVISARKALKLTDDGESLRVDRAVEYLLRQR